MLKALNFRQLLDNVPVTAEPVLNPEPGNIERFPIDKAADAAHLANNQVVAATCEFERAQQAASAAVSAHEANVAAAHERLTRAIAARERAQRALLRNLIEAGALEGCRSVDALIRGDEAGE